ncbi:MAG: hypothetical protein ISR73_10975, partial [Gammaproteobacteria bacterium]|nr:hypothetical protein [Gammaproteobacteria bacterium]
MFKHPLSILLLLSLLSTLTPAAAEFNFRYPRSTVSMELHKVSEHVYFVQGATGVATDNQGFISNAT